MDVGEHNFVGQMKKKNARALEYAVDHYANLVVIVVHNVLNSGYLSQYADECVNDVFWAVWNHIDSFDEQRGCFKSWLAAVARYRAIDYRRRLLNRGARECSSDGAGYDGAAVESAVIARESGRELLRAINELKAEDREIFIRRYFLDDRIESIADSLQVDRNLVDKRLSRGRKLLREKLRHLKGRLLP